MAGVAIEGVAIRTQTLAMTTAAASTASGSSARETPAPPGARRAIFIGGAVTGALDITAACILAGLRGFGPVRVFHGIAAALIGPASQSGGAASAALGLLMHFSIATFWTAVFYFLSRRIPALVEHPFVSGPLYGALVFILMYRVVLPLVTVVNTLYLTDVDKTLPPLRWRMLLVHLVCVGLPIALSVRRFGPAPRRAAG